MFSCKDCQKRYVGCHAKCKEYIDEKKAIERIKSSYDIDRQLREYEIEKYNHRKVTLARAQKRRGQSAK